jgi:hypothetical protein
MISRVTTELLLTFSPTITFLLSVALMTPARSQTLPAEGVQSDPIGDSSVPATYLIVYRNGQRNGQIASEAEAAQRASGARLRGRKDGARMAFADSLSAAGAEQLARDPGIEPIVPEMLLGAEALEVHGFCAPCR